jgi:hypothetical protein
VVDVGAVCRNVSSILVLPSVFLPLLPALLLGGPALVVAVVVGDDDRERDECVRNDVFCAS